MRRKKFASKNRKYQKSDKSYWYAPAAVIAGPSRRKCRESAMVLASNTSSSALAATDLTLWSRSENIYRNSKALPLSREEQAIRDRPLYGQPGPVRAATASLYISVHFYSLCLSTTLVFHRLRHSRPHQPRTQRRHQLYLLLYLDPHALKLRYTITTDPSKAPTPVTLYLLTWTTSLQARGTPHESERPRKKREVYHRT
jgi:hypothetical protein